MTKFIYRTEFGSSHPIRFVQGKVYDADENEIVIPECEKCGNYKSQLIGKENFIWICTFCHTSSTPDQT